MEFSEDDQCKHISDSHLVYYWIVGLPIIPPHCCMPPLDIRCDLWFTSLQSGYILLLKYHIDMMVFSLFISLILTRYQCLSSSWALVYFIVASTNSNLLGWLVVFLKVKLLFPSSVLEVSRLVKFGRFSSEYLDISSLWSRLAENSLFTVVWTWCNTWPQMQIGQ